MYNQNYHSFYKLDFLKRCFFWANKNKSQRNIKQKQGEAYGFIINVDEIQFQKIYFEYQKSIHEENKNIKNNSLGA